MLNLLEREIKELFGASKKAGAAGVIECSRIYVRSINRCGLKAEKAYAEDNTPI